MRIVFFGSGDLCVPTLRALQQEHEVLRVVTQPDRPSGRGRKLTPVPAKLWALELGLAVTDVEDVNAPEVVEELLALRPEIGVVIAFGQKIGPALLDQIPGGCINAHASLLPKYRGAAPIHWAIINGEDRTGITVFKLVQRMDAGPVLLTRWTFIKPEETTEELHDRLSGIAVDAVREALHLYAGGANPAGTPQDESLATRAPKLSKADGVIDFNRPALEIARLICGTWSWPGARCQFVSADGARCEELVLARARRGEGSSAEDLPPGSIDGRMLVAARGDALEVLQVKPAGGKLMTWPEFVNGRHVRAGDRLQS